MRNVQNLWTFLILILVVEKVSCTIIILESVFQKVDFMDKLKKRQVKLLNYLMDMDGFRTYTYYAELLDVSTKTLQRDVLKLNQYLKGKKINIQAKNGVGIRLVKEENKDANFFQNFVRYQGKVISINNEHNRLNSPILVDLCINLLLYHDDPLDIVSLLDNYEIKNERLKKDIEILSTYFAKYNIRIIKSHDSLKLEGMEKDYRNALTEIIIYILDYNFHENERMLDNPIKFNNDTFSVILEMFKENDIVYVNNLQKNIKLLYNREFTEQEYMYFSIGLLVTIYRIKQNDFVHSMTTPQEINNNKLFGKILNFITNLDLNISQEKKINEAYYFYNNINSLMNLEASDIDYSKEFCEDFIDAYSYITDINVRSHFLYENLVNHLLLLFQRISTNTTILNPILESIEYKYPTLHSITTILCSVLRQKYSLNEITNDEISFLVLYLNSFNKQKDSIKIGIFCNMTKSIGNHIYSQVKHFFPEENIKIIETAFHNINFNSYDLIVSTKLLNQDDINIPYVYISPMCDETDIKAIHSTLQKINEKKTYTGRDMINIINELMDLGVTVTYESKDDSIAKSYKNIFKIHSERVNNITYVYYINQFNENLISISEYNNKKLITYNMSSVDYILASTKLTYFLSFSNNISFKNIFGRGD